MCQTGWFGPKRGGWVLFAGNSSYVVDGVGVVRWLPVCFCALLRHFSQRFGEGVADGFSDIFLHGMFPPEAYFHCAPLGVNCTHGWPYLFFDIRCLFCLVYMGHTNLGGLTNRG